MNKIQIEKAVMRFVGDSGDGIQLIGNQLSESSVMISGNDIYTFVEFPAEIRAPAGSISGVSGFQLSISSKKLYTIDDKVDLLVAFNPAALKTSINYIKKNGIIIIDTDSFNDKNIKRAGFENNPLNEEFLKTFKIINIPITKLTFECVKDKIESISNAKRCKNFFALGIICWIYDRNINIIINWIIKKFKEENIAQANKNALMAGFNYANTIELLHQYEIPPIKRYNKNDKLIKISGNKAFTLSALASTFIFKIPLFSANYPITPASDILHDLSNYINHNLIICQLEDEIAAINAIIGSAYAGCLSLTCTSGPGLDLMQEGIGLAIMAKMPVVIINIQRCGPSTGIPTRSEQTDLNASIYGRHGESEVIVLAPNSPSDCFYTLIESFYYSIITLSPIIILSDANIANSSELWKTPTEEEIIKYLNINAEKIKNIRKKNEDYWIIPGEKNIETCIGGLERDKNSNNVSYSPENHEIMTIKRKNNLDNIVNHYKKIEIIGDNEIKETLIITWGSVYGIVRSVYEEIKDDKTSLICLRYLNPLPKDLITIIKSFKKIIVIEENNGQLASLIKKKYLIDLLQINTITGKPFKFNELKNKIINIV